MTEAKATFTPGPWTTDATFPWEIWPENSTANGRGCALATIHADFGNEYTAEDRANAHLIASAPALYAACKVALARIESDIESPGRTTSEGDAIRSALARAEGGGE